MTSADPIDVDIDPFAGVVGQDDAVAFLRLALAEPVHAYLFLGPHGSGKRAAARAFAAGLLAAGSHGDDARRHVELALGEQHPDLVVVEREGAAIRVEQATEIIRRASRSPIEGHRKVLVLDEFHLVGLGPVAPMLLKTIEEPPDGTFFLVLADEVPPELVTIASRCVRVDFRPVTVAVITDTLVAEGVAAERAAEVAAFAEGDLRRARLLATDDRLGPRLALWRTVPGRLDGRGATAATLVDELRANIDDAEAPLRAQQDAEVVELNDRIERYGQRGSGARQLDERHRRERRRIRTDELRLGLAVLARAYRDEMASASPDADRDPHLGALDAIQAAAEALIRNPNEELLLLGLLSGLPVLRP